MEELKEEFLITAANLAPKGKGLGRESGNGFLVTWDPKTWTVIRQVQVATSPLVKLAISNDSNYVAVATTECTVFIYETSSLKKVTQQDRVHHLPITGMSFSPDNLYVLTGSADKTCALVPIKSKKTSSGWTKKVCSVLLHLIVVLLLAHFFVSPLWPLQSPPFPPSKPDL